MRKILTTLAAVLLTVGCSQNNDFEEITPNTPPRTDYATTSVEIDATTFSSRLYDTEGSWSWQSDDTIAGMHLVKFNGNATVANTMALKDNGKFGCDEFAYSSTSTAPYLFVYPASAVTLDTSDSTGRFATLQAAEAVQDGVYNPLLVGMHTGTIGELSSVELEAKTACIEVRVWSDKNSENRGTRPVDNVTVTTTTPLFTGYYTMSYTAATNKTNYKVTNYDSKTISTDSNFEGAVASFEVLPGTDTFEITLTDGTETKTITTKETTLAANDRYIVNITWEYQPAVAMSGVNSWYNDYYTNGNTATTLEPGYLYLEGLEYLHGTPTVYVNDTVATLLEGNRVKVDNSGEYSVYATVGEGEKMVTSDTYTLTASMTNITLSLTGLDSWYNQYYTLGNTATTLDAGCIYLNGYSYTGGTPTVYVNDIEAVVEDGKITVGTGEYTIYATLDLLQTEKFTIKASKEKTIINLAGATSWYKQFSATGNSSLAGNYLYLEGYSYSGGSTPTVYVDGSPATLESGNRVKVASGVHTVYAEFDGVKTLEYTATVTGIPTATFKMHSNYNDCDGNVIKANDYANTIKIDTCTATVAAEDAPYFETPVTMWSHNGAAFSVLANVADMPAEYSGLALGDYRVYIQIKPTGSNYTLDFGSKKSVYVTGLPYKADFDANRQNDLGWTRNGGAEWVVTNGSTLHKLKLNGGYIVSPAFYAPETINIYVDMEVQNYHWVLNSDNKATFTVASTSSTTTKGSNSIATTTVSNNIWTEVKKTSVNDLSSALAPNQQYLCIYASRDDCFVYSVYMEYR